MAGSIPCPFPFLHFQGNIVTRIWMLFACLLIGGWGCSSRHSSTGPSNVVGFQLPTHQSRLIRKGHTYEYGRRSMEDRLQKLLGGARFTYVVDQDGVLTQYESKAAKLVLQLTGTRTGIERATLRLHRPAGLTAKQKEARERELKIICQTLQLGDDGTKWVSDAACVDVAAAIKQATEVHEFGKTTYALKAFKNADAEIDNESTNPRLWICIGPHIEFEVAEQEVTETAVR
jgi:hypothetical protein